MKLINEDRFWIETPNARSRIGRGAEIPVFPGLSNENAAADFRLIDKTVAAGCYTRFLIIGLVRGQATEGAARSSCPVPSSTAYVQVEFNVDCRRTGLAVVQLLFAVSRNILAFTRRRCNEP